jgi:hypothetical protein
MIFLVARIYFSGPSVRREVLPVWVSTCSLIHLDRASTLVGLLRVPSVSRGDTETSKAQ